MSSPPLALRWLAASRPGFLVVTLVATLVGIGSALACGVAPRWPEALATVVLAVCATLSTFKGGSYSGQSVINQTLASNQWAYFQAKSTKQNLHELQADSLRLQALSLTANNPAKTAITQKIDEYTAQIARYAQEMKEIETQARILERQRDDALRHNRPFSLAVMFLQVAILLNSVAGLLKIQKIWWSSLPFGLTGLVFFADGFFTFL